MPEKKDLEILIMADITLNIEVATITIKQFVKSRLASGMSITEIRNILQKDLIEGGQLFGDFRKNVKSIQRKASEDFARLPMIEDEERDLEWVGIGDSRVCPDCIERNYMKPKPYAEWAAIGLPGDGATVCGANCRCFLMPVSDFEKGDGIIRRKK